MKGRIKRQFVTFQRTRDSMAWEDHLSCHAYINGLSGQEFFIANGGFDSSLAVEIECRYFPELMEIIPSTFRAVDSSGVIYELISPADDIRMEHRTVKFRAKRVTSDAEL